MPVRAEGVHRSQISVYRHNNLAYKKVVAIKVDTLIINIFPNLVEANAKHHIALVQYGYFTFECMPSYREN